MVFNFILLIIYMVIKDNIYTYFLTSTLIDFIKFISLKKCLKMKLFTVSLLTLLKDDIVLNVIEHVFQRWRQKSVQ